jgi:tetratricopeptide (TPR) repeat protein
VALILKNEVEAVDHLEALQEDLIQTPNVVHQLHSALMAIYLEVREKKAYQKMLDLYARLPRELQNATVVLEQLSLAYNRMAEAAEKSGQKDKASELREEAIHTATMISEHEITSETFGILGRIHKAQYDAYIKAGEKLKAEAALIKAIETYEKGLLTDPRDYYPSVNAITLRVIRGTAEDEARLNRIVPVVRFAIERAPEPEDDYEKYWRVATELELACTERDWQAAREHLLALIPI